LRIDPWLVPGHEPRIRFRVADLLGDPLAEPPFDLVVCSDVLY
jgi:chemotaxis methyl-accepting protein methylase